MAVNYDLWPVLDLADVPKSGLAAMMAEQSNWIAPLLPNRDVRKTCIKLSTETAELLEAVVLNGSKDDIEKEAGDVLVLLLDICYLKGIDPDKAFRRTMDINYEREWVAKNGSLTHVKKAPQE